MCWTKIHLNYWMSIVRNIDIVGITVYYIILQNNTNVLWLLRNYKNKLLRIQLLHSWILQG